MWKSRRRVSIAVKVVWDAARRLAKTRGRMDIDVNEKPQRALMASRSVPNGSYGPYDHITSMGKEEEYNH